MPDDLKKVIRSLGMKSIGMYDQGDPKAIRDCCCICGKWTEDLNEKTKRCNEDECKSILFEFAIRNGLARKTKSGVIIGDFNRAAKVFSAQNENAKAQIREDMDMCSCKNAVKRPNDNLCVECRLKDNRITNRRK